MDERMTARDDSYGEPTTVSCVCCGKDGAAPDLPGLHDKGWRLGEPVAARRGETHALDTWLCPECVARLERGF